MIKLIDRKEQNDKKIPHQVLPCLRTFVHVASGALSPTLQTGLPVVDLFKWYFLRASP